MTKIFSMQPGYLPSRTKAFCGAFIFVICCLLISTGNIHAQTTDISNFATVDNGIYRGGRPKQHGVEELKQMGIKTIVNLEREIFEKEPGEVKKERQWAEKAGIRFFHVPMHPFFAPKMEEIKEALTYITNPENQPVFVHCDRGSDRTGIVIAAYRITANGWSAENACKEMKKYGHSRFLFWWKWSLFYFEERFGKQF